MAAVRVVVTREIARDQELAVGQGHHRAHCAAGAKTRLERGIELAVAVDERHAVALRALIRTERAANQVAPGEGLGHGAHEGIGTVHGIEGEVQRTIVVDQREAVAVVGVVGGKVARDQHPVHVVGAQHLIIGENQQAHHLAVRPGLADIRRVARDWQRRGHRVSMVGVVELIHGSRRRRGVVKENRDDGLINLADSHRAIVIAPEVDMEIFVKLRDGVIGNIKGDGHRAAVVGHGNTPLAQDEIVGRRRLQPPLQRGGGNRIIRLRRQGELVVAFLPRRGVIDGVVDGVIDGGRVARGVGVARPWIPIVVPDNVDVDMRVVTADVARHAIVNAGKIENVVCRPHQGVAGGALIRIAGHPGEGEDADEAIAEHRIDPRRRHECGLVRIQPGVGEDDLKVTRLRVDSRLRDNGHDEGLGHLVVIKHERARDIRVIGAGRRCEVSRAIVHQGAPGGATHTRHRD